MVKISQSALVQQSGNDIYFIIEGPCDGYFTEKVSQAPFRLSSTFRMAATLFHSALLMPPLNEPTNLEK